MTRAGAGAAIAVVAPQTLAFAGERNARNLIRGGKFAEGVASGDPAANAITLWTRLDDVSGSGRVLLEVATDRGFRRVVKSTTIATNSRIAHSVKARLLGLDPLERYYYRFETDGEHSPVGRFTTAPPADSRETVRFAFFSCSNYEHGFFNAYELLTREDIDFAVHLGDYIYDDPIPRQLRVRRDNISDPSTLDDFRGKYKLYRTDSSLRKLHSQVPFVTVWDDHESEDNYAGGDPSSEDYNARRDANAYRAWFESMPHYAVPNGRGTRIYRSLVFGRTLELIMLDQRQYRDDQPCNDAVNAPDCPERQNPRDFLGRAQMRFLKGRLDDSRAAWKAIGNQLLISPARIGNNFAIFDNWDGYPREREELLGFIQSNRIEDVVFLTGDLHTFATANVNLNEGRGATVAHEFHSGSITSQGLGEGSGGVSPNANDQNPNTPQGIIDFFYSSNPWSVYIDFDHHGYGLAVASRNSFKVTYRRLRTIKRRSIATLPNVTTTIRRGQLGLPKVQA